MQNKPTLERLQKNIIHDEIAYRLDRQSIGDCRVTSRTMYLLFQEPSDIAKLLHFVQEGNYQEAENLAKANPLLVIKYVSCKKIDGTYGMTSPAKLAFKMRDTYMWKMFLKIILGIDVRARLQLLTEIPNDFDKYKNSYILVYPELYSVNSESKPEKEQIKHLEILKRFLKQELEQIENIELDSFFTAYKNYDEKYDLWLQNKICKQALNQSWLNVGNKQRYDLPRHMLLEFCRIGTLWNSQSNFDVDANPSPASAKRYRHNTKTYDSLLPFTRNSGLAFDFSLVRGEAQLMCEEANSGRSTIWPDGRTLVGHRLLNEDFAIFHRLLEVRISELMMLHSQSELTLDVTMINEKPFGIDCNF